MNKNKAFVFGCNSGELKFAKNDAKAFACLLETKEYLSYDVSLGQECTLNYNQFLSNFDLYINEPQEDYNLIFYFAGHGIRNSQDNSKLYIQVGNKDNGESIEGRFYEIAEKILNNNSIKSCLIILDCCHGQSASFGINDEHDRIKFLPATGINADNNEAIEDPDKQLGVFTSTLIDTIEQHAESYLNFKGEILITDIVAKLKTKYPIQIREKTAIAPELIIKLSDNFVFGRIGNGHYDRTYIEERSKIINHYLIQYDINSDNGESKWMVDAKYGFNELNDLQENLREIIMEEHDEFHPYNGNYSNAYFDAIQSPEIALLSKAIYTFPFFLTPSRLPFWGIIPYGKHLALGILYRKTSSSVFKKFDEMPYIKNCIYDYSNIKIEKPARIYGANHWINKLIEDVEINKGRIYSVAGYMFNEILPLLIHATKTPTNQERLMKVSEIVPLSSKLVADAKEKDNKYTVEDIFLDFLESNARKSKDHKSENDIAIIDLAQHEKFKEILKKRRLSENYGIVPIYHYLNIPIGIGFSLKAYEVLKHDNLLWNKLKKEAINFFVPDREGKIEDQQKIERNHTKLKEIGITII